MTMHLLPEQESMNLITLSDTGEESGQILDKEFAKATQAQRFGTTNSFGGHLSFVAPYSYGTAINHLKPDIDEREEKIEQALLDLQNLGITFGQVTREEEPSQDLNLSDLA